MNDLQSLGEHLEQQDVEAFTESVKAYDAVNRLDPWYNWLTDNYNLLSLLTLCQVHHSAPQSEEAHPCGR